MVKVYCNVPESLRTCGGDAVTGWDVLPTNLLDQVESWRNGLAHCRMVLASVILTCEGK